MSISSRTNIRIAVQPDHAFGGRNANWFSEIWLRDLKRRSITCDEIDLEHIGLLNSLREYDGLLWRPELIPKHKVMARRMIPVLDRLLNGCIYPDTQTYWHYDDKVAEAFLFDAIGIPTPATWVFWSYEEAMAFLRQAKYPLMAKLAGGAQSSNVRIIRSAEEGQKLCEWLFQAQLFNIHRPFLSKRVEWQHRLRTVVKTALKGYGGIPQVWWEPHKGYALFQEFVPGNNYDTRVCVVGEVAWAYRRLNRPHDYRASGSGRFDMDPSQVDEQFIHLAFAISKKLGMQSCAVDGVYRNGKPVILEMSYAFGCVGVQDWPVWRNTDGHLIREHTPRDPAREILCGVIKRIQERTDVQVLSR
jgi:glutathione synthase/RimK-type ligase-like ATP-grasp enzyme